MKSNSPSLQKVTSTKIEEYYRQDRIAVFEMFDSAFRDAAEKTGGTSDHYFAIADRVVCLRFAGDALVNGLTRALAHLATESVVKADLTVNLWDSKSTKRPLPLQIETITQLIQNAPWLNKIGRKGEVFPFSDERFVSSLQWGSNIFSLLDKERNECIYWIEDVDKIPYFETGAPLRAVLYWWFSSSTLQLIHGGAVGTKIGGVLLGGEGGAGKSTTALNCLNAGFFYASDDYVFVDIEKKPTAYSVFQTAKVKTKQDMARFPEFEPWTTNSEGVESADEKPMIFVGENRPEQIAQEMPINAIVFPCFVPGENCRYEKINEQRAFRDLVTSTINQTPFAGAECVKMLAELVRRLPSYLVTFGENQENLAATITQIIKEHS